MAVIPYKAMTACGRNSRLLIFSACFCTTLLWYSFSALGVQHGSSGDAPRNTVIMEQRDLQHQNGDSHQAVLPHRIQPRVAAQDPAPVPDHAPDPVEEAMDQSMISKLTDLVEDFHKQQGLRAKAQEANAETQVNKEKPIKLGVESDLDPVEAGNKKTAAIGRKTRSDDALPDFSAVNAGPEIKVDKSLIHDKWIVVTSVVLPTADVMFLANLTDWKVVVVGDVKTPHGWKWPNCVFLSVETQTTLGFSVTPRLPFKSYARKNIGYLFAIAHGAKVIYETDDDNRPLDRLTSFRLEARTPGLLFSGLSLFNPYRHFGQSTLWPRGYPLGDVGVDTVEISYRLSSDWPSPLVQQGVVNGDPDMDAIFRLTRKKTMTPLDVKFDPVAPFVILPEGVFSPFNSQNTLFLYDALWALLLPTTTTFRMCDIWRGYWAQRLLWEVNGRLAFFPANAYQQRNAHSYMADAADEKDMYYDTDRLLNVLTSWTCEVGLSFFQCVYQLSVEMAKNGFWDMKDAELTKSWLENLIKIGYKEPTRQNAPQQLSINSDEAGGGKLQWGKAESHIAAKRQEDPSEDVSELDMKWAAAVKQGSEVLFTPAEQVPPNIGVDMMSQHSDVIRQTETVASFCPTFSALTVQKDAMARQVNPYFHDVLLIVVYNWPFYNNIRYNEAMYRVLFPNIVYCGENITKFQQETYHLGRNLSFVEAPMASGLMGYECTIRAMQMSYNVRGYFVVGEDVILNTWNFENFDKSRVWMSIDVFVFNATAGTDWMWWKLPGGDKSYHAAMSSLRKKTEAPNGITNPQTFLKQVTENSGADENCIHTLNDVYYIPRELTQDVIFYLSHFAKYRLMVEMAVPMTLYGLKAKGELQFFKGVNLWLNERTDPWPKYSTENHFLHPVKFTNETNHELFCKMYLASTINLSFMPKKTS